MKKFLIKTMVLVLIVLGIVVVPNLRVITAQVASAFQPAGGPITQVTYCTCDASVLDYIQDRVTNSQLQLLYMPGVTNLYEYYDPFIAGPQTLGNYIQGSAECLVVSGDDCDTEGNPSGIWYLLGTTAY